MALYNSISLGTVIPRNAPDNVNGSAPSNASGDPFVNYICQVIAILSDGSLNNTNCTAPEVEVGYDSNVITPNKEELNCTATEISTREEYAALLPPDCRQYIITAKLCKGC